MIERTVNTIIVLPAESYLPNKNEKEQKLTDIIFDE